MNKKGAATGEWIIMMYHLLLVSLIAFIVLGVSGVFYAHQVNIRDSESLLMTRTVLDCLTKQELNSQVLDKVKEQGILNYCNFQGGSLDQFFVRVTIKEMGGEEIKVIEEGDSGALWIKKMFIEGRAGSESNVKKYTPGYTEETYEINYEGKKVTAVLEVLLKHE